MTTMESSINLPKFFIFIILSINLAGCKSDVSFELINKAGVTVELFWVNPAGRDLHPISSPGVGIANATAFRLSSFVGHEFEVREMPSERTGECANENKVCHSTNFVVPETENDYVLVEPSWDIVFADTLTNSNTNGPVVDCHKIARKSLSSGQKKPEDVMHQLASCLESNAATILEQVNLEISFESKVRKDMAGFLENYTCIDYELDSSPDVSAYDWVMPDAIRKVHVKHNRSSSQIHVVENFISQDECVAMETEAAKTLHRAAVADGKGGSQISPNRKAMQAGIRVQWDLEAEGDFIAKLSRRVYDYTENVLKLGIKENGQEDLMSIQYFGRGRNDTEPDRYTPHCDGDCSGLPHKTGTRVATMVMYCKLPESGGSTNFRNSMVHVKPVVGNAIFFSYIDPGTKVMDSGFTEHSGCPVYEGEKKIVTQWIRYGVDDENPWNSFNTLGIKKTDAADQ